MAEERECLWAVFAGRETGSQQLPAPLSHCSGDGGRFQAGVARKRQCQSPGCGTAISLHTLSRPSWRKAHPSGNGSPSCVLVIAKDSWFSSSSPSFKAPTDTWVCCTPHRIFRLSIFLLLQGISIDDTSQPALFTQSY